MTWFDIGDPAVFGSPGSFSVALAYGAPDPSAPEGIGNLGNFIYVGTATGQIYVTQDGGGSGTSNNWINISTGLDGSPVEPIITDPTRGSHDAYAVTTTGVFFIANSIPSASNPTPTWVNITGNLHNLAYTIFGQTYNPTTDPNSTKLQPGGHSDLDRGRLAVHDPQRSRPTPAKGYHPVLYVGSNSGVYQSLDDGQTWTLFPDTTYGAVAEGGNLPHVAVTDLSLSLGNIDANTGMPNLAGPYDPTQCHRPRRTPTCCWPRPTAKASSPSTWRRWSSANAVSGRPRPALGDRCQRHADRDRPDHHRRLERDHRLRQRHLDHDRRRDADRPDLRAGHRRLRSRQRGPDTQRRSNSTNALGNFAIPFDPASVLSRPTA